MKPQFSLKTLLVVVTLFALLLGIGVTLTSGPAPTTMIYYPFGLPKHAELKVSAD